MPQVDCCHIPRNDSRNVRRNRDNIRPGQASLDRIADDLISMANQPEPRTTVSPSRQRYDFWTYMVFFIVMVVIAAIALSYY